MSKFKATHSTIKWYVMETKRPDAGNLWNIGRLEGNRMIESEGTPTHSRALAQQWADKRNAKVAA